MVTDLIGVDAANFTDVETLYRRRTSLDPSEIYQTPFCHTRKSNILFSSQIKQLSLKDLLDVVSPGLQYTLSFFFEGHKCICYRIQGRRVQVDFSSD